MTFCSHSTSLISCIPSFTRTPYLPPHKRQATSASIISEKPMVCGPLNFKSLSDMRSPASPRKPEYTRTNRGIALEGSLEKENVRIFQVVKDSDPELIAYLREPTVGKISSDGLTNCADLEGFCPGVSKVNDQWLMEESSYFEDNVVPILWGCKDVLADLFSTSEGARNYNAVRNAIFPKDVKCSMSYRSENRAHDILEEIFSIVEKETHVFLPKVLITEDGKNARFLDVCGAPGGWSACIFRIIDRLTFKMASVAGFGVSLAHKADRWKSKLISNPSWTALYGPNGNGDVRDSRTVEAVAKHIFKDCIQKKTHAVKLAVADGSISMADFNENLQELHTASVIIGELRLIMAALVTGGHSVIKIFDTFSDLTASIVFVCCQIFADVLIVKPTRSRVSNSERFLVGISLKAKSSSMFQSLKKAVDTAATLCVNHTIPNSIVPIEVMREDLLFMRTMKEMVQLHCERQIASLNVINSTYQKLYGSLETDTAVQFDTVSMANTDALRNMQSEVCDSPPESLYFDSDIESLDGTENDSVHFSKKGNCNREESTNDRESVHSAATVSTSLTTEVVTAVSTPVLSSEEDILTTDDTPTVSLDSVLPSLEEQQPGISAKISSIALMLERLQLSRNGN